MRSPASNNPAVPNLVMKNGPEKLMDKMKLIEVVGAVFSILGAGVGLYLALRR